MNKKLILSLFALLAFTLSASAQLTSLNENFNTCPDGSTGPSQWSYFNPVAGTQPLGMWKCGADDGRSGTPGISCSGYFGSPAALHTDTAILISPRLDLSGYVDSIYLNFDTKTTNINLGAKLELLISKDTGFNDTTTHIVALRNVFDKDDSTNWVTHQANLTQYKYNTNFFVGFRYISTTGTAIASRWFLDNVNTNIIRLPLSSVQQTENVSFSFKLIGEATTDKITIAYESGQQQTYELAIYDMTGRLLHREHIQGKSGHSLYTISSLQLSPGMYMVKMGNEAMYKTAKLIVQ